MKKSIELHNYREVEETAKKIEELEKEAKKRVLNNIKENEYQRNRERIEKGEEIMSNKREELEEKEKEFNERIKEKISDYEEKLNMKVRVHKRNLPDYYPKYHQGVELDRQYRDKIVLCIQKKKYAEANRLSQELERKKQMKYEDYQRRKREFVSKEIGKCRVDNLFKADKKKFYDGIKLEKTNFERYLDREYDKIEVQNKRLDKYRPKSRSVEKLRFKNASEAISGWGLYSSPAMEQVAKDYIRETNQLKKKKEKEKIFADEYNDENEEEEED